MVQAPRVTPFDLHVLGTPPAFVLSQDQTLVKNSYQIPLVFNFVSSLALPLLSLGFSLFSSHSLCSFLGAPPRFPVTPFLTALVYITKTSQHCQHFFSQFLKKFFTMFASSWWKLIIASFRVVCKGENAILSPVL